MTLIVIREIGLTPRSKNSRTTEAGANAHFAKCFADRKALISAGRTHDDEDNHIDDYCHFDSDGYAEPCDEYGRLIGMEATNDQRAEETGAANGGDMATGYLHYSVENIEDTIDVETYDRALNEVAEQFGGQVEGTAVDPQTNTRTVRLTFNDVQTLEKFKTEVVANPPKLYRLKTPTHAEKVSKLKERMDTFVGRTVEHVRVGTFKELNVFPEVLWWHDAFDADNRDSEVWAHITFTDGFSISFEASSIGFPMVGKAAGGN